ncbi:MAG: hypothetical protein ABJ263_14895 [Tateyamaria sp.]|uniref:hypothetical protein n=1 Tax=Tateyamaria sp. TaxID=1929288 RepID=UPI003275B4BB
MMPVALATLLVGIVSGFTLARRFRLRTLVALVLGPIALIVFVSWTPADMLPGDGYAMVVAAYLIAPPLAAGLFGGAVFAWLFRNRTKTA